MTNRVHVQFIERNQLEELKTLLQIIMTSNQIKIETFDKYIMRGGDQSLSNIEIYVPMVFC